jgi:alpha-galactosidase
MRYNTMNELEKQNTVRADGQVSKQVSFEGTPDGSPRIMFVGNSITRHGPLPSIGWHHNWGMAASCKENDYVHLIISEITKKHPDAAFCIVQASIWECNYTDKNYDEWFSHAKDFNPDVIFCAISGNIKEELFTKELYVENINSLLTYLSGNKTPKIFHSSSFFDNKAKNEAICKFVSEFGHTLVPISDVKDDKSNLAIGQWEHEGIQVHPCDKGMSEMARRFLEAARSLI